MGGQGLFSFWRVPDPTFIRKLGPRQNQEELPHPRLFSLSSEPGPVLPLSLWPDPKEAEAESCPSIWTWRICSHKAPRQVGFEQEPGLPSTVTGPQQPK